MARGVLHAGWLAGAAIIALTPALAETPLRRVASGELVVDMRVGGRSATPFVMDTGVEMCGVYRRFAEDRRLLAIGGASRKLVRAPEVEIDGAQLGALTCAVLPDRTDGAAVAGVIGADALQRYVVVFDARTRTLSLHGGAQRGQHLVSTRARLVRAEQSSGGLMHVPVELNGARGVAVIDTGAQRSVINRRFAAAAGVEDGAASLGALSLAGQTRAIGARVADLPVFASLGLAEQPAMILGRDGLEGLRLVMDYPRRRIWFDPG